MIRARPRPRARARCGFTLTEALLALAITSLIGLAILFMLSGVASATSTQTDSRRSTVRREVAAWRLGGLVRAGAAVLDEFPGGIVLWTGDTRPNAAPDLSELRLIRWNDQTGEVVAYAAQELDPLEDVTYDPGDDFEAITSAIAGSAVFPGRVALQGVTEWSVALDDPDAQSARRIRVRVMIEADGRRTSATLTAALRGSR